MRKIKRVVFLPCKLFGCLMPAGLGREGGRNSLLTRSATFLGKTGCVDNVDISVLKPRY